MRWGPGLLIAAIALAASASGLRNGFAYDDVHAVAENERLHTLADPARFFTETYWPPGKFMGGSTLYRPLTSLAFALEWAAGGGQGPFFHWINVLLYLLVCLTVLWAARAVLPLSGAMIAAALYAAHPVHVEAVANVVGQGELWVNLFALLAVGVFLYGRNAAGLSQNRRLAIYGCYALACLAKDNGLMLPGLLLAAELTVVQDPRPLRERVVSLAPFWVVLGCVGLLYLALRTAVTGTLAGDYPHILIGTATYPERVFTMLRVALEWPRLLLWPAHLQADYSPRDFERALAFGPAQFAGLAMLLALAWLTVWAWRRRPVVALGMLWFAVAIFPVSNLVLKAGIVLAERTLFLPSAGVVLALGAALCPLLETRGWVRRGVLAAVAVVVLLGTWRSALRQPVWRDTATLFAQSVQDAPLNYRVHWTYALNLYERGLRESAYQEMATAIALYPYDPTLFSDAGDLYRTDGKCIQSLELYQRALMITPELTFTRSRLASCYMRLNRFDDARRELQRLVDEGHPEYHDLILAVDSAAAAAHTFR
jgi:tetratricopeptide (TPR) repeat protein